LKPCILNATSSFLPPPKSTKIDGFAPDPTGGAYNALTDPLAGLRGPLLRGGDKEGVGMKREGVERGTLDPHNVGNRLRPLLYCTEYTRSHLKTVTF